MATKKKAGKKKAGKGGQRKKVAARKRRQEEEDETAHEGRNGPKDAAKKRSGVPKMAGRTEPQNIGNSNPVRTRPICGIFVMESGRQLGAAIQLVWSGR